MVHPASLVMIEKMLRPHLFGDGFMVDDHIDGHIMENGPPSFPSLVGLDPDTSDIREDLQKTKSLPSQFSRGKFNRLHMPNHTHWHSIMVLTLPALQTRLIGDNRESSKVTRLLRSRRRVDLEKSLSTLVQPSISEVLLRPEPLIAHGERSEERRVGKECRSRWSPDD